MGIPPRTPISGLCSWEGVCEGTEGGAGRRVRQGPGATAGHCCGKRWDGASLTRHTHTHSHRLTLGWPRAAPARAPHPASRCSSYSPSARERISDTVLRMVGIAAATAGGSSGQTLHLSRRRAGRGSGFPAPSAQQPRGPSRPPRAVPLPGETLAHRREKEEVMKAAASAELSELCLPTRRERRGAARGGAGTSAPGEGSSARPLTRTTAALRERRERGGERLRRASCAPPCFGPYHPRGGRGRCRPPPPQAPSSRPVASALPVFSQRSSDSSKSWPERKGYCGSCILANPLPPPSSFNNNGVARGAEVVLALSGLESGERSGALRARSCGKALRVGPPGCNSSLAAPPPALAT